MKQHLFGPKLLESSVEFRFWAPKHPIIKLKAGDHPPTEMRAEPLGWHVGEMHGLGPGELYRFILPDGLEVPDPASRYQPQDVHGPSEIIDPDFAWAYPEWKGRPWEEMIIYELHVGTFTEEGTFLAATDRLAHLRDLGITAIQLMPVSDFPGRRSWGYDGVLPYAPDSSYGRPEDLKRLVDAAHGAGICVFLDVVYNHFGPEGNYLPTYAPIFTDQHRSPWGDGINYDGEQSRPVREFVIQNALYWLEEFKLDGLRLDAVRAIKDDSDQHLLVELAQRARRAIRDRHIHLVVENENNDSDLIARDEDGQVLLYNAQWNDDIHHVLHIVATGETFGYYGDYADDAGKIGRALAEGFVFQGEHMAYRGESRGKPSAGLPPTAFVAFIQNHDQIGNRAHGDRMSDFRPAEVLRAIAAIYLLSPQIPMLFMGEEWGARQPFPYFCDFDEDLNEKVRQGRKRELSRLPGFDADDTPDPTDEKTFRSAKLDWRFGEPELELLNFYRRLLAVRQREIVPRLTGMKGGTGSYSVEGSLVSASWGMGDGTRLHLLVNLSDVAVPRGGESLGDIILAEGPAGDNHLGPWTVIWSLSKP